MNNLEQGETLEACFQKFSASINGLLVEFNGKEYIALDYRMKNGKWVVDLYSQIDCDQAQFTEEACHVTVV